MDIDSRKANKAYRDAVKQLDEEKTKKVKDLVVETMRALDKAHEERRAAVKKVQTLKRDLADLREGRLDRVIERHRVDKNADKESPVTPQRIQQIFTPNTANWTYTTNTAGVISVGSGTLWMGDNDNWNQSYSVALADAVKGIYTYNGTVREL